MEYFNGDVIQPSSLCDLGLIVGVSTKNLGNMSLVRDIDGKAEKNLKAFLNLMGIRPEEDAVLFPNLTHSANIALVRRVKGRNGRILLTQQSPEVLALDINPGINPPGDYISRPELGIDACVTVAAGTFLALLPADCAPICLYDPARGCMGIVHAGVLGAFSGVLPRTIECMQKWASSQPGDIVAYIGPCISSKAYDLKSSGLWKAVLHNQISEETAKDFDLKSFLKQQLLKAGLAEGHIETSRFCTGNETELFFSNYSVKTPEEKNRLGRIISLMGKR